MPLPDAVLPVRMRRIAVVAPENRLRDALVELAEDGNVELSGELPALVGPQVDALRRLERESAGCARRAAHQPRAARSRSRGAGGRLGDARGRGRARAPRRHRDPSRSGRRAGRVDERAQHRGAAQPARVCRCRTRRARIAALDRPSDASAPAAQGRRVPAARRHLRLCPLPRHRSDAVCRGHVRAHVRHDVRRCRRTG